jgi:hypothetical protein
MVLTGFFLFWIFHCYIIFINGAQTDLSMLTTNQTQIWLKSISQVNSISENLRIEIIPLGSKIEISLYNDQDDTLHQNRHLFKQNINKRVYCYVYENQINTSISSNIYDPCHGTVSSRETSQNLAGTYLYTGNQISSGLGIILIEITKSFQWFNNSISYTFNKQSNLKNGTQLFLAFETPIYYNSNSDLIYYNKKIDEIIQQANISIKNDNQTNLETFFFMENLSCQRHSQIIDDDLRLLTIVCTTKVTFICPLQIGSTCWIEEKRMSNIQLNIDSYIFISDKTITVRIDV